MSATEAMNAIRDLVIAAEAAGWDNTDNSEILERAQEAYAALRIVHADEEGDE
jgi:hypothetical protein